MNKESFNGSFLVLNLGTNTLELGNSLSQPNPSESVRKIATGTTPHPPNPKDIDNALDNFSSSTGEGCSSASETSRTKRGSDEEEDPEWVPAKRVRKTGNGANRAVRSKEGPSVSSNPRQPSAGGFNGMLSSSSGPMPPHLMSLLSLFGWKVMFQPGNGEYVYISPSGIPYFSLSKAFETFLQGTSKYSDKASAPFRYLENSSLGGSLVQTAVASTAASSSNYLGIGRENATTGIRKKRRCARKRPNVENAKPVELTEDRLKLGNDPSDNSHKQLQMAQTVKHQEDRQASPLCNVNEKSNCDVEERHLNNEFNRATCSTSLANTASVRDGKSCSVRRPVLSSGRHVHAENEMDVISGYGVCGDKVKDKEQNPTSESENMLKQRPRACRIVEGMNSEDRNSDFNNTGVMNSHLHNRRSIAKGCRSGGLRRSGRLNKKTDILDRKLNTPKQAESTFSTSNGGRDEEKLLVQEGSSDEKTDCSTNDESLLGESKRSDCSSAFFSSESNASDMHACCGTTGIRRSTRINGKHVPVDDDSDLEIVLDDCLLSASEFGADTGAKKNREKTKASGFELDERECGNAASGDSLKQTNTHASFCQESKLNKSCVSLKDQSMELRVSDKCRPSSIAREELFGGVKFNGKKMKKRRGCGLTVRRNGKDNYQDEMLSQTSTNILSWLIDSGILTENERVYHITTNSTKNTPGFVTRRGIWCDCCKEVVPLSKFVAHAGGEHQQPWDNIFLLSGKTLLLCLKEAWEKQKIRRKIEFSIAGVGDPDPSDDTCGICADGGHLICCDSCPSTFHQSCLMLKVGKAVLSLHPSLPHLNPTSPPQTNKLRIKLKRIVDESYAFLFSL